MPGSKDEVAALKAEGERMSLDDADNSLQTHAEIIAYLIHRLRADGADRVEILHDVEVLVRASGLDRVAIRTARDVLAALSYGSDITRLMTALARRAPRPPPTWSERMAERAGRRALP